MPDQDVTHEMTVQMECRPRLGVNSHLGAVLGCMDYLGVAAEPAWVYGVSGHAFMLNIARGVCCSGPQSWDWQGIWVRTPALGIDTSQYILSFNKREDFSESKKRAIAFTRENLAAGVPVYGAEFGYPEWYTVTGANDEGFAYRHQYGAAGTWGNVFRTWEEFGTLDVGLLFVGTVRSTPATADDHRAVAQALDFALAVGHAGPGQPGGDTLGLRAYDAWIAGLRDRAALAEGPWNHPDGTTYNAGFWHDARTRAAEFLRLCPQRLSGRLAPEFARAAGEYAQVAEALGRVHEIFPFGMGRELPPSDAVEQAVEHLRAAQQAEWRGLELLAAIRHAL